MRRGKVIFRIEKRIHVSSILSDLQSKEKKKINEKKLNK